jgi:GxxExxY protein
MKTKLIYADLTYKINGALFRVFNDVGTGHKENFYQQAVARELSLIKLKFIEQLPVKINYKGKRIGLYYFDFLVENKVVLEIKVRNYFSIKDIRQVYSYLKAKKLELGIIAHFTNQGVKTKRVLNIN